ncbi:MAG: hypothetical protein ACREBE_16560, partial [bacterium]
ANQWVVLHQIGTARSGPLDSTRTGADGRYKFRYQAAADTAAIYFATTLHGGIVYPTAPFRSDAVSGDEATITVFDTTSGPVAIKRGGRHLIIGAQQPNGRRPIGEVYDLENDTTVTVIARDSLTPLYTVHVPSDIANFRVNGAGEFGGGALARRGNDVGVYAPLSPGIRQFAFTYELPGNAFPLAIPMEAPTGVLEILIEDPTAEVRAPSLREVAPQSMEGRTFRRFLAQDLPPNAILRVNVPRIPTADRQKIYLGVALALLAAMLAALAYAALRPRRARVAVVATAPAPARRSHDLVRAIADLDDEFGSSSGETRGEYEARRAALKAELANALAAERSPT